MSNKNRNRALSNAALTIAATAAAPVSETVTTAVAEQTAPETGTPPKSIRSLVMSGLLAGRARKDIAADIVRFFPNSAAAVKSTKHISWYAGRMKKDGVVLPKPQAATVQAAAEPETSGDVGEESDAE